MVTDEGLISTLVSLDLSVAFDTIDHHFQQQTLEHQIGIEWFEILSRYF